MKKLFLGILLFLYSPLLSYAVVIPVSACSSTALSAAHTLASNGDTLQFPSCNVANWTGTVTITKQVHIKGTGKDTTKIRKTTLPRFMIFDNVSNFSLCCMTLEGTDVDTEQANNDFGVEIKTGIDFSIFDMKFTHFFIALTVAGNPQQQRGVIYNSEFIENFREEVGGSAGYGVEVRGNSTYLTLALGTDQNLFVEDNLFQGNRHAIESTNGSRYVFRRNRIIDNRENASAIDAHGDSSAYAHGSRQWEIYNNWVTNATTRFAGVGIRGGDGVIFNNTVDPDSANKEIAIWIEDIAGAPGAGGTCACTYPCFEQTTDAWVWNNTPNTVEHKNACDSTKLVEGRDYHLEEKPGYTLVTSSAAAFPPGKQMQYPTNAPYPHRLRQDPPIQVPSPPAIFHVAPIIP